MHTHPARALLADSSRFGGLAWERSPGPGGRSNRINAQSFLITPGPAHVGVHPHRNSESAFVVALNPLRFANNYNNISTYPSYSSTYNSATHLDVYMVISIIIIEAAEHLSVRMAASGPSSILLSVRILCNVVEMHCPHPRFRQAILHLGHPHEELWKVGYRAWILVRRTRRIAFRV